MTSGRKNPSETEYGLLMGWDILMKLNLIVSFTIFVCIGVSYSDYESGLLWSSINGMTEDKYNKHLLADIIPAVSGMAEALGKSVL